MVRFNNVITVLLTLGLILCNTNIGYAAEVSAAYPIGENNFTAAEKQQQRNAAYNLNQQIAQAIANGSSSFEVPQGVYRFNNDTINQALTINNASNLTIDFSNSTFYSEQAKTIVKMNNCDNVKLENLTIDYDPLPYVQGIITSIDSSNNQITILPDVGFPIFDSQLINNAVNTEMKVLYFTKDGSEMAKGKLDFVAENGITDNGNGTYTIKLKRGYAFEDGSVVKAGMRIAIPWRTSKAVFLEKCKNCILENITIYSSPGYGINERYGDGNNTYKNINITRRPGTTRLISCNADTFHSGCMKIGPKLDNCNFSYMGDDGVNIRGFFSIVTSCNEGSYYISSPAPECIISPRDELDFYHFDSNGFVYVNKATVASVSEVADSALTLSQLSENIAQAKGITIRTGLDLKTYEVTLTGTAQGVDQYDFVLNRSKQGNGAVIRNSKFSNNISRGVIIRCDNAAIIDNVFEKNGLSSIAVRGAALELESGVPKNILIKGNVISNANFIFSSSYNAGAIVTNPKQSVLNDKLSSNIIIADNIINDSGDYGIVMSLCSNSVVMNNIVCKTFKLGEAALPPYYAEHGGIRITYTDAVILDNNISGLGDGDPQIVTSHTTFINSLENFKSEVWEPIISFRNNYLIVAIPVSNRASTNFKCKLSIYNDENSLVYSCGIGDADDYFNFYMLYAKKQIPPLHDNWYMILSLYSDDTEISTKRYEI